MVKWIEEVLGIDKAAGESKTDELYRALKKRLSSITGDEVLSVKAIKALKKELKEVFEVDLKIVGKDYGKMKGCGLKTKQEGKSKIF